MTYSKEQAAVNKALEIHSMREHFLDVANKNTDADSEVRKHAKTKLQQAEEEITHLKLYYPEFFI